MLNNNSINFGRGIKIIDIQDSYNYKVNHYPGSVNIPYDELMNNYRNYLNKRDSYYIYCKSGKLSRRVVTVLSYLGYNVSVLEN
jgi:rhodanese-related sulfurtransferase